MSSGNGHQSKWSQEFHAARGDAQLPCPVAEFGGHGGTCKEFHPRGVVITAIGGWKIVPPIDPDDIYPLFVEHYV